MLKNMDGKIPSCTTSGEHNQGVADNTPWGYQALDDTNDPSSHPGTAISEGNYGERWRWAGGLPNRCPPSLRHMAQVSRMQGILSDVPSSSTSTYAHNATMSLSQDCQEIPFGPTPKPIKFSSFPTYQHPCMENLSDVTERESMASSIYNSMNDHLAAEQQQALKGNNPSAWTSVIKESLEMSNGMELEQDLSANMRRSQVIYDPPTESGAVELKKNHLDCVEDESNVQERRTMSKAQALTFMVLSDDSKLNQDSRQKRVFQCMDPLIDGSTLNDKVLRETSCRTIKRCLSAGFYDTTEDCSLAQSKTTDKTEVSHFIKRPCLTDESGPVLSNMHEQSTILNKYMSSVSLPASNNTGSEKGISVLGQELQYSSCRTYKEHVQSCKNGSALKCKDGQTKSYTDNNAGLHRHVSIPGHHLKFDTASAEPGSVPSSTSNSKQDNLVCNCTKGNPSTPMEDLRTCIESEEIDLPVKIQESTSGMCAPRKPDVLTVAAQSSRKVVRKQVNGGARMLDETSACSQSHSSCEISSSDTNNTDSSDKETDNGQINTQNIMNAGQVSDDTNADYNSQEQSQSLSVSSNPETGVTNVFSLLITSKERTSEVNIRSPQTSTGFLEKETGQVEPYKDHTITHNHNYCPEHEHKLRKRVGCGIKKRKLVKMTKAFSRTREPSENVTGHSVKLCRDLITTIKSKAKERCTAVTTAKGKNVLQNSRAETEKDRCCRKSREVKHPGLVPDGGQEQSIKLSNISRHHIGMVFKASSGLQPNNFPKGSSKTSELFGCFEDPVKTEKHNEKPDMPQSNAKDLLSSASNTLLKTRSTQNKDANATESIKETLWNNSTQEKAHSTEVDGGAAFELSLHSTVNNTGFQTCITNARYKTVKDGRSRKALLGESAKASNKELSEKDVGIKNSPCGSNAISLKPSPIQKVDGFTQYSDEDCMTTLNKDTGTVADASKSTKIAKKYITCKYCHRFFRHISAYTVHQRIHTGEKPYRCELCGKNFAQLSKLKSHRNVHVQSASLPCPCCRKKFSDKRDLIAHFRTHIRDSRQNNEPGQEDSKPGAPLRHDKKKLMSCKTCGKEFWKSSQLVVHEKTHWPVKPYACSICAKGFNRIKALKRHSQTHTGEMPFSCSHCGCAFFDLPALRMHQISKLCKQKRRDGENGNTECFLVTHGVDGEVHTPVFFKCQICKQLYQKWCQYILHLQTHTNSLPYLCFACGQSYDKDTKVNFHCRVCCQTSGEEVACGSSLAEILHNESRKYTCLRDSLPTELYSIEASKSQSLSSTGQFHNNSQTLSSLQIDHIMPEAPSETVNLSNDDRLSPTPSGTNCSSLKEPQECVQVSPNLWRFKCPRCGQRYKRYRTLCLHMQTHAPAFRYVCGHCRRSFERWNKLWLHQRIHCRKGRSYTCSQCSLQFHFFSSYEMHLLNHAEERPYACPLCPRAFACEEDLHVHQCSFHQPLRKFQCNVCDRGFSSLAKLVKHNLLHNGAISHQCLLCSLCFANNKSLQEHLSSHNNSVNLLPSIPSEPLTFLHKCNRCKVSFSTGDLLYAHQICHTRDLTSQMRSTQSIESTSVSIGGTQSSTSRSLLSTLDLDAIPNESLFKYPHPDKLYVPSRLSRMSKSIPIINLDAGDEELPQEASTHSVSPKGRTGPSGQKNPGNSEEHSERVTTHPPQAIEAEESVQSLNIEEISALHMDTVSDNLKDKASHNSLIQTIEIFETSVFLEGASTTVNVSENEMQDEIFECADCSEKLGSLIGLYEHYFLHALGSLTNRLKYTEVPENPVNTW